MKNIFILTAILLVSAFKVQAQGTQFCSQTEKPVCVLVSQQAPFTSQREGEFDLEIQSSEPVSDLAVALWMNMGGGHGHGSGTVEIQDLGPNQFHIRNAWFVMKGAWIIKVRFTTGGMLQEISIPVAITE